jgi:hypothetical protein
MRRGPGPRPTPPVRPPVGDADTWIPSAFNAPRTMARTVWPLSAARILTARTMLAGSTTDSGTSRFAFPAAAFRARSPDHQGALCNKFRTVDAYHWPPRAVRTPRAFKAPAISARVPVPARLIRRRARIGGQGRGPQ